MALVESPVKAFQKARKSRQYQVSRQNSVCWRSFLSQKTLTFRGAPLPRSLNFCHPGTEGALYFTPPGDPSQSHPIPLISYSTKVQHPSKMAFFPIYCLVLLYIFCKVSEFRSKVTTGPVRTIYGHPVTACWYTWLLFSLYPLTCLLVLLQLNLPALHLAWRLFLEYTAHTVSAFLIFDF